MREILMGLVLAVSSLVYTLPASAKPDIYDVVVQENHDVAEINHYYDGEGKLILTQYIWWDRIYNDVLKEIRFDIVDFRFDNGFGSKFRNFEPIFDRNLGLYVSRFFDNNPDHTIREIRTTSKRETWTQYDVELVEREWLSPQDRRLLIFQAKPAR